MTSDNKNTTKFFGFTLPAGADGELLKQTFLSYLTGAFLLVVFLLFVMPKFADVNKAKSRVREVQKNIDRITKTLDSLDNFRTNIDESMISSMDMALPETFDPGYILISLKKLAAAQQITLLGYSLGGGTVSKESKNLSVTPHILKVDMSGGPLSIVAFLDALAVNLPLATVSDLSISEVGKLISSTEGSTKMSLELTYYNLPFVAVKGDSIEGKYLDQKDFDVVERISGYGRLDALEVGGVSTPVVPKDNLF